MTETLRRLALGLGLIAAASALLLFSDLGSRKKDEKPTVSRTASVALLQHASQAILDQGRDGMIAGLAERGWVQGENLKLRLFNAEGDMTVSQSIAREMVNGGNDLLMTISTPSLQAVANANRSSQVNHVFGLVANPYTAGVGVTSPTEHPEWLTGCATMQPVKQAFEIARKLNPKLKSVGVAWNAAEANAEAQIKVARQVCQDMGINLVELTVENSAGVGETAAALVSRGVEAIWICGDVTVMTAVDTVIAAANRGQIPVFTVVPPNVKRGALFDIGADYFEVGRLTGLLAGDVLNGTSPAAIPVENVMPEILTLNQQVVTKLKDQWTIPGEMVKQARTVIRPDGTEHSKVAASTPVPRATSGRIYRIALASYNPEPSRDSCEEGLLDGLRALGYVEGENLVVSRAHAQGDAVNIVPVVENFESSSNEAIVTFTTQLLQAAAANVKNKPIVFTYVTDPIAAGVGKSMSDHLPHVTGIGSLPSIADNLRIIRNVFPKARTIGTVYNSGEANSTKIVALLREACEAAGLKLVEVTATNTGEVMQATQALVSRNVDLIYLPSDNTMVQAIDGIVKVATDARIPLINDDPGFLDRGVLLSIGPGFYHSGKAAAPLLSRVLNGESPENIPFQNVVVNEAKVNAEMATKLGVSIPAGLQPEEPKPTKKWKIAVIAYNENPPTEETLAGMTEQWGRSSLKEGRDYEIKLRSAQGDIAALSGILDAALTEGADMVVPLSTPSLQAAINKVKKVPVVFSLIANPVAAGAGKSYTDHLPNVTGVSVLSPAGDMLDLLEKYYPKYRKLGTLYCPAEANSVDLKEAFAKMCKERGFTLEVVAANSASELADAAMSLASRPIDAIVQISDNLSSAGFVAISKAARQTRKPLLSLNSTTAAYGAPIAMGRDYHYCGEVTVQMIEQIMRGADPSRMPFVLPPKVMLTVSPANAEAVGMPLPEPLIQQASKVLP